MRIGETIFYPLNGIGRVLSIEDLALFDKQEKYYKIEVLEKKLTVLVPVSQKERLGIRSLTSKRSLIEYLHMPYDYKINLTIQPKNRRFVLQEKLSSGSIIDLVQMTKDLRYVRVNKGSFGHAEIDVLKQARKYLEMEYEHSCKLSTERSVADLDAYMHDFLQPIPVPS